MSVGDERGLDPAAVARLFAHRAFVRVYRMPEKLTDGYCFDRGVPIVFTNVDWFEVCVEDSRETLASFIKERRYYDKTARFLVQSDHPEFTFMIDRVNP